jgi:hypothetical protein
MKIKFTQSKGNRFYKQFIWITTNNSLWWSNLENKWIKNPKDKMYSSCKKCKSVKAFKRHLKKHPEIQGNAVLVSRFYNCDVLG